MSMLERTHQQQLTIVAISVACLYLTGCISEVQVRASNEGSYKLGYQEGIGGNDIGNTCVKASFEKDLTNSTACGDGYFKGYKDWCFNSTSTKQCLQNIFQGDFPDALLKIKKQYLAGNRTANGSGTSMCPIEYNAAFCAGWNSNNDDYGGQDCADHPLANISQGLIGCPADIMTNSQIGGIPELVGKWNFMNQTRSQVHENIPGIRGTMLFNNNGYYLMTVPNHNVYDDYTLEAGWGTLGHNILTICYAGGCENSTLTTVSPDYIKFKDNNHNTIQLFRIQPTTTITTSTSRETANKGPAVYTNLSGTWNLTSNGPVNKTLGQITFAPNNEFTGTFDANRQPVQGSYTVLNHTASPFANLTLNYIYHNHAVKIDGSLNVTDHDNMKMMYISVHDPHNPPTVGSDYKITTGLYLRPGYIISLTRSPPIGFTANLIGDWTFYNQTSPAVTAELAHGFTAKQRNMTDILSASNFNLSPNIQTAIKTKFDKEKWTDYIMSLARLKTGDIRFDSSTFQVTPPDNNGSCIAEDYALGCGPGEWRTDGQTLKLTYYAGSSSKDQGPAGPPLQLPPRTFLSTILTFKSVTPERIIATDSHNDTIYFIRDHPTKTLLSVNLVGNWKFSIDVVNGTGPSTSGKFVFERGTSEFPSSIGEFPTSNANFTEIPLYQRANGTTYTFTPDSIKRGNWEIDGHMVSLYYFNEVANIWLLKVINNDSVILFGNNGKIMHLVRIGGVEN